MPYIEVEELPEGTHGVDVVPRADYDAKLDELGALSAQRDEVVARAEKAEAELKSVRDAYARAFVENKQPEAREPEPEPVNTYDRLFA